MLAHSCRPPATKNGVEAAQEQKTKTKRGSNCFLLEIYDPAHHVLDFDDVVFSYSANIFTFGRRSLKKLSHCY